MRKIRIRDFDLKKIVECGQIFRWEKISGWYFITAGDRIIKARQEGNFLFYELSKGGAGFIRNYFSLGEDYKKIISGIKKDEKIGKAIKSAYGLRLIKQEPFECMVSYISSSASNIPRIRRNMNSLSRRFGHKIKLGNYTSYSFPSPEEMLKCEDLEKEARNCGLGFRARFYSKAIAAIAEVSAEEKLSASQSFENYFSWLRRMNYPDAKMELMNISGVGSKVANCILAFSLGFKEAFPTDVWIRRAIAELYFSQKNISAKDAERFGREYFGQDAAYAQEFLYYWRRQPKAKD